jgi:hypothetical protein
MNGGYTHSNLLVQGYHLLIYEILFNSTGLPIRFFLQGQVIANSYKLKGNSEPTPHVDVNMNGYHS